VSPPSAVANHSGAIHSSFRSPAPVRWYPSALFGTMSWSVNFPAVFMSSGVNTRSRSRSHRRLMGMASRILSGLGVRGDS
jgi:hypothetical protein